MPSFPRDPFVATHRGYRRKIGPASKYATNDKAPAYGDGIGPQGAQSSGNYRSSFTGQTRLGTPHAKQESRFASSMREARAPSGSKKARAEYAQNEARFKAEREEQDKRLDAEEARMALAPKKRVAPRGPWTPAFKPKPLPTLKK